jgi:hypothetical protein
MVRPNRAKGSLRPDNSGRMRQTTNCATKKPLAPARLELRQGAGSIIKAPGYQGRRTGRKCLRSQQLAHVASAVIMRLVEFGRKKARRNQGRRGGQVSSASTH